MVEPNHPIEHQETSPERKEQTCEQEFDPYEYGKEGGIGRWEAAIHLYRYSTGFNIIIVPFIMKNLGWLMGALTIMGTGIVIFHTTCILLSTEYKVCKRLKLKRLSQPELIGKVFRMSPYPLNKFSYPMKLLLLAYYSFPVGNANILVVMSSGIQTLATFFDLQLELIEVITILVIPLSLLGMSRRLLKILVPFSLITSIFTFCITIIIVVNSVIHKKDDLTVAAFGDVTFIPKGVSMLVSLIGFNVTSMAVKNNMVEPKKLVSSFGALTIAAVAAILFNYTFGAISYICYGDAVRENILTNLPQQSYLNFGVILLYTVSGTVSYQLNYFTRFDNVWTNSLKNEFGECKYATVLEYSISIAFNLISYLLAVAIPDLTVLCTLLGLALIIVSISLPAVLELVYLLTDQKKSCCIIFKDICIIGLGAFIFVISLNGCVEKIKKIYEK